MLTPGCGPHFVVAGLPRTGTTYLYHNLQRHPGIHLPWRKELNYLNLHRDRGARWYADQLAGARPGQLIGDIEPGYALDPEIPARLQAAAPGVKVVLGVREPVSWVRSLHAHFARLGDPMPPLGDFAREGWDRRQDGGWLHYRFGEAVYTDLLASWRRTFGADLLLYDYAAFARDRLGILRALEAFLGLPAHFAAGNVVDRRLNASQGRVLPGLAALSRRGTHLVDRLVPREVARRLRLGLEGWAAAPDPSSPAPAPPADLVDFLAPARRHHDALFAAGPVIHGDGSPLLAEAVS